MTDTVDPRLVRERDRIKNAREKLAKAEQREKQIAAEVELTKRRAEITQGVQTAVKQALSTLKLTIPADGLTIFVHSEGDNGSLGVDVKIGKVKSNGNGERKSISSLGIDKYILPDGKEVTSASAGARPLQAASRERQRRQVDPQVGEGRTRRRRNGEGSHWQREDQPLGSRQTNLRDAAPAASDRETARATSSFFFCPRGLTRGRVRGKLMFKCAPVSKRT